MYLKVRMKLTIYMAISIDGLITRGENDSSWVSKADWDQFYSYIKASDVVIMGRKTMEQFGEDFPIKGPLNIVLSHNKSSHKEGESLIITSKTPTGLIKMLNDKGLKKLLLIGGSNTNKQFLQAGLVDEIILSVHPLVIGDGLRLFGNETLNTKLQLISTKPINNELVQIIYKVIK